MYAPLASAALFAKGVKSTVVVGTLISSNVAPFGARYALAAKMLPRPKVFSSTKRITFLPLIGLMPASGAKSCSDVLPERNKYLLAAEVIASFLAGHEM